MIDWSKPIFENDVFHNPSRTWPKGFRDLLRWVVFEKRTPWPRWVETDPQAVIKEKIEKNEIHCVMINHATLLIQTSEGNILTDPVFSDRISPFSWLGPSRRKAAGIKIKNLPNIDYVLISHNHYDHMDIPSLYEIWRKFDPFFILPLKNFHFLFEAGIHTSKTAELSWWQKHQASKNLIFTLTPAQHWSSRSLKDRNKALWGGFWIQNGGQSVFFAGDTGYADHFLEIKKRLGKPTLSLLPIGAYEPRWFMRDQHMNPEDAVQAHLDLETEKSIAIHWGTWPLTYEGMAEPVTQLRQALEKLSVSPDQFLVLENGEHLAIRSP